MLSMTRLRHRHGIGVSLLAASYAVPAHAEDKGQGSKSYVLASPAAPKSDDVQASPAAPRPIPTASYWLTGAAIGSFISAGVIYGSAMSSLQASRSRCAPNCSSTEKRAIDAELLTSDIMGIVGVVTLSLAVYVYITRPEETSSGTNVAEALQLRLRVAPAPQGALCGLSGSF